ncbi:alpha-galactosidase [Paenibacillus allorhizosphaerae]|uniref:Alpha-galactosidase n=1 Tax=Paenibacillus allorhizosphaerae TaxID=2849866 RepID=A0ABN7TNM8_9BACL|nr:alpha-galactosidase [Paenibacillus allorhizosphaerae]CAG7643369.1 Alpha-galactosidase AgaA [Paenibacillus allorhizosphaerae]
MSIHFDSQTQTFHLQAKQASYIMQIVKNKYIAHVHWGRKIRGTNLSSLLAIRGRCSFTPNTDPEDKSLSLDTLPQELPSYGSSDFRVPAYQVQTVNGSTVSELIYDSHRIYPGKPLLDGLPATYVEHEAEAETLEIVMKDELIGLKAILTYTVFHDHNAVARSVRYLNEGGQTLRLLRALSMSIDFAHSEFDMLHLSGSWARERHIETRPLTKGGAVIESRRGASSHSFNPFIALLSKDAGEEHGEAYGFSLVYSGSFVAQAEVDPYSTTRVVLGINPFDFSWLLEAGESFQTPEAVLVYSAEGLGGMSRTYHRLYRTRLCRGEFRDQSRPVLVNNWEATYFNFDADKIEAIARAGEELGIELFVLDDGWFGKRDNDKSSLGDWFVDKNKLPNGLEDLVGRVKKLGMQFGLWFEPEMVSPDSELYRAHPDWCLHVPDRRRTTARTQLILDYSRADVREYIVKVISDILASCPITYVKWDMNRNMTEIGSALLPPERQRETAHRYMLGLYEVLEKITTAFPHILFESCSGGGGRFDPGMLYYMPQTWTSDNTDAVERLKIQYGTSIVYPISSMGSHVSAIPNHQVHRMTPIAMRGHVAMSGNFGYELDLTKFTEEEKAAVKQQVAIYKELRPLIQFGDFYRLLSPFEGNETAWMFVSEDRSEALVAHFQVLAKPNPPLQKLRLRGLDLDRDYRVFAAEQELEGSPLFGGDELMHVGVHLPVVKGDFKSWLYRLQSVR